MVVNRMFPNNGKGKKKGKVPSNQNVSLSHVFSIIPATGFYAKFIDRRDNEELFIPIIAWAFAVNNAVIPLIYDKTNSTCINPMKVRDFISIEHDIEDDDDDEEDSNLFGK